MIKEKTIPNYKAAYNGLIDVARKTWKINGATSPFQGLHLFLCSAPRAIGQASACTSPAVARVHATIGRKPSPRGVCAHTQRFSACLSWLIVCSLNAANPLRAHSGAHGMIGGSQKLINDSLLAGLVPLSPFPF